MRSSTSTLALGCSTLADPMGLAAPRVGKRNLGPPPRQAQIDPSPTLSKRDATRVPMKALTRRPRVVWLCPDSYRGWTARGR